jgi:hypothetical protein
VQLLIKPIVPASVTDEYTSLSSQQNFTSYLFQAHPACVCAVTSKPTARHTRKERLTFKIGRPDFFSEIRNATQLTSNILLT